MLSKKQVEHKKYNALMDIDVCTCFVFPATAASNIRDWGTMGHESSRRTNPSRGDTLLWMLPCNKSVSTKNKDNVFWVVSNGGSTNGRYVCGMCNGSRLCAYVCVCMRVGEKTDNANNRDTVHDQAFAD